MWGGAGWVCSVAVSCVYGGGHEMTEAVLTVEHAVEVACVQVHCLAVVLRRAQRLTLGMHCEI